MKKIIIIIQIYFILTCLNINLFAQVKEIYDLEDHFEKVDGLSIPKLSKNKMFIEENNNYEKYFDVNKEIKIKTSSDSFSKILSFYNNDRPTEIQEEYTVNINKLLKYDYEFKIKYRVRIRYYNNGKIRSYEVHLRDIGLQSNLLEVGTWYFFEENGKVYKKIDHEKHYKMGFKDIFKIYNKLVDENYFLKEKDEDSPLIYYGNNIINRFTNDIGESYWIINLPQYSVVVDDKWGKIIEKINRTERERLGDNFLKSYYKSLKTEKKTGYYVKDDFDVIDGIPIPKLSKDKMFFKNNKRYQKFYEKNVEDNLSSEKVRTIEIKNQYNPINKKLYFKNNRLKHIKENYTLNIIEPQQFSTCNCVSYNVTINYYSNGNIKSYSIYSNYLDQIFFESPVGVWYKFDENGKILKKIDIEQMYKTTYNDILKLTKKTIQESRFGNAIDTNKVSRFVNDDGNAYWIITYAHQYSEIIDDKTGNVIERSVEHDSNDNLYKKYERNSIEYKLYKEFLDDDDDDE